MDYNDLQDLIQELNDVSEYTYRAWKMARQGSNNGYNDRPIHIYFENDGRYAEKKRWLHLITIHDHKFGAINSLSDYMGYEHANIFQLVVTYAMQRRSERASMNHDY